MTRRIGIFGGSFDPVHLAHLALGRAALDSLQLDELRWVPAGQPWQKARTLSPAQQRLAMLRLALADEPRFVLDPIETQRAGPSYTLDTVRALQLAQPQAQWVLIIGQDQYAGLHTWHGWQALLGLVTLAVARRPGVELCPHEQVQQVAHELLPLPMMDISSSDIRSRVAARASYASLAGLVSPQVAHYIAEQRLYQPGAALPPNPQPAPMPGATLRS